MSLFKTTPKTPEAKPKTLFGAMSSRASAAQQAPEPVVVDKGKSFALFRKPAKPIDVPVEPSGATTGADAAEAPHHAVEDVQFVEQPHEQAAALASKSGWLSRRTPTEKPAEKEPVAEAKPARAGWFSRDKKAKVEAAERPVEKPAAKKEKTKKADTPKAPRGGLISSRPATSVFLHTELNEGTRLWWKLTASSLERVAETDVNKALTFSTQDYRYAAPKKLQYGQANNVALAEASEYCSLVNASGGPFGAVHATPRERAIATPWLMQPGMLALDRLLTAKLKGRLPTDDIKAPDAIVGFSFGHPGSENSLVVLYKLSADHELSNLQISVNSEDISFVLNQFAQAARINSEDAPVILFSAEELLAIAGSLDAFPNEAVWQGYSVRKLLTGALAVSAVAAVVGAGLAGTEYVQQVSLKSQKTSLQARVKQSDEKANVIVSNAARSFAQKTSLDQQKIFAGASNLWMPGAVVVMTADYPAGNTRYELRMKLPQGEPTGNRPSVAFALSPEALSKLVDYKAEDGCVREGTYIAGSLNEVQIIVNCQVPVTPLSRYRLE